MAKPRVIELPGGITIPILHEDRAGIAIDKPAGWMLAPEAWQRTGRNLQAALISSLRAGDFWARSRNLKFLRFVHRLDAETSGIVLLARSPGAVRAFSRLFEERRMTKTYLAVVEGAPRSAAWVARGRIGPEPGTPGRMRIDPRNGKPAETHFRVLGTLADRSLVEVRPVTGRTHQIRVHLAAAGLPVVGDPLYGRPAAQPGAPSAKSAAAAEPMALRAVALAYADPFTHRPVRIQAPAGEFARAFGFEAPLAEEGGRD